MNEALIVLIFILIVLHLLQMLSVNSSMKEVEVNTVPSQLKFSIIVAAKNEESNIKNLIEQLNLQDYDSSSFEVIIVDDNSSDNTFIEANAIIKDYSNFSVHKNEEVELKGKRGALQFGISKAKYDFILITDADCSPSKGWISAFNSKFSTGYDMLLGIVPFYRNKGIVNFVSCYENFKNTLLGLFFLKIGLPYTAAARSFGFSKRKFYEISGYKNTTDTLSGDDDLLLREAIKNKLRIGAVTDASAFVLSDSKNSWKNYFHQRARHTQSSFHYLLPQQIMLTVWHFINLAADFSLLIALFYPQFIILFSVKMLFGIISLILFSKRLGYRLHLLTFPFGEIVYGVLILINFINSLLLKPKWR